MRLEIAEQRRPVTAHFFCVALHHAQVRADVRGKVGLVDDHKVAEPDRRAAFARNFVAAGNVDDVDERVHQFRREGRRQVVAATLDEDHLKAVVAFLHLRDGLVVHRRVIADRRVRTAAGLDADDSLRAERTVLHEKLLVLERVNIVRDHGKAVVVAERLAEPQGEHGFAGADRPTQPNPHRPIKSFVAAHEIKSRLKAVSCRELLMSSAGHSQPISSMEIRLARSTTPPVWPKASERIF